MIGHSVIIALGANEFARDNRVVIFTNIESKTIVLTTNENEGKNEIALIVN